jgi:hypothetical protein
MENVMSNDVQKPDDAIAALREQAQQLRSSAAVPLKYTKGKWTAGNAEMNGAELIARPDWTMRGWVRLWDGKATTRILGYVADRYVPPPRQCLGDHDRDEWAIYCKGRDPWILQFYLPFYSPVSGEQFIWSTNSNGGERAIGNLLTAYVERVSLAPEDGTVLPRVLLNSGGYNHPKEEFFVATPEPDIVGWVKPPATPRPLLPAPPPLPLSLPPPTSSKETTKKFLDDEVPFVLVFFIVSAVAWCVAGGSTLIT